MRPKKRNRAGRARGLLLAASLFAAGLGPTTAHANTACVLSGPNGSFKVLKLVLPGLTDVQSFSWVQGDPIQYPFTDRNGYTAALGFFIVNASTHQLMDSGANVSGASAPAVVVRAGGQDRSMGFPATREPFFHSAGAPPARRALPAGTYYLIGFGWGTTTGLTSPLISGSWNITIDFYTPCTPVAPQGEFENFNQTDFTGGTHVYIPPVGVGSNLKLAHSTTRNTVVGTLLAGVNVGGSMDLSTTPPGAPTTHLRSTCCSTVATLSGGSGEYNFGLAYNGVNAVANITLLQLAL